MRRRRLETPVGLRPRYVPGHQSEWSEGVSVGRETGVTIASDLTYATVWPDFATLTVAAASADNLAFVSGA